MAKPRKQADIDFEIAFYEGVLSKRKDFVQALMAVGDLYTKKGLHEQGLAVDKDLARLRPEDPVVFYNLACSYSLVNHVDKAFAAIKKAVSLGYRDFDFLEKDADLDKLKADPHFKEYFIKLEKVFPPAQRKTER